MSHVNASAGDLPRVFVLGAPSAVGGADTELWHTLRLWRDHGLEVSVVPTSGIDEQWRLNCERIGCDVHRIGSGEEVLDVPGLRGALVVSFCNGDFLQLAGRLRQAGCRVIWAGCMTWIFPAERHHYYQHGLFDHCVFQSRYQQSLLMPTLKSFGFCDSQGTLIRGPFALDEFPYRPLPRVPGEPFVVGRISRADADKYSPDTWSIYGRIASPIRARVMAWNERIERKLGAPPPWAECLPVGRETAQEFFGQLHCMVQVNGGVGENWPRSGLEAMASGVPVVAENRWGWTEMIRHGITGYLADSHEELVFYANKLAQDEEHRLTIARNARRALEEELAPPETLWRAWCEVFRGVARQGGAPHKEHLATIQ